MSGIKHSFQTNKSDNSDTSIVRPTKWNAKHNIIMGSGVGEAEAIGRAYVDVISVGTDADTVEKTLMSYSLPANALSANGNAVRIRASGSMAANANNKTVKLYFGAMVILDSGVLTDNNKSWEIEGIIYRIGVAAQLAKASIIHDTSIINPITVTPAEDETGIIIIKITGQNGTASLNDIICRELLIEWIG